MYCCRRLTPPLPPPEPSSSPAAAEAMVFPIRISRSQGRPLPPLPPHSTTAPAGAEVFPSHRRSRGLPHPLSPESRSSPSATAGAEVFVFPIRRRHRSPPLPPIEPRSSPAAVAAELQRCCRPPRRGGSSSNFSIKGCSTPSSSARSPSIATASSTLPASPSQLASVAAPSVRGVLYSPSLLARCGGHHRGRPKGLPLVAFRTCRVQGLKWRLDDMHVASGDCGRAQCLEACTGAKYRPSSPPCPSRRSRLRSRISMRKYRRWNLICTHLRELLCQEFDNLLCIEDIHQKHQLLSQLLS